SGLESTSSRNYGAWVTSRNWVRFALTRDLHATPGTAMEYSTGNTHLLSAILPRETARGRRRTATPPEQPFFARVFSQKGDGHEHVGVRERCGREAARLFTR